MTNVRIAVLGLTISVVAVLVYILVFVPGGALILFWGYPAKFNSSLAIRKQKQVPLDELVWQSFPVLQKERVEFLHVGHKPKVHSPPLWQVSGTDMGESVTGPLVHRSTQQIVALGSPPFGCYELGSVRMDGETLVPQFPDGTTVIHRPGVGQYPVDSREHYIIQLPRPPQQVDDALCRL